MRESRDLGEDEMSALTDLCTIRAVKGLWRFVSTLAVSWFSALCTI